MDKLLEALTVPWTRRWSGQVAAAAVVFWTIGLYLNLVAATDRKAWCAPSEGGPAALLCRTERHGATGWVLLALLAVAVLVGSALLVAAATPRILQTFTGSGRRGPFSRVLLWRMLARRRAVARRAPLKPQAAVVPVTPGPLSWPRRRLRLWRAEWRRSGAVLYGRRGIGAATELRRYPRSDALLAPTRTGCLLAALGERVRARHGLDLPLCWEPFLAVLPSEPRRRLEDESRRVVLRVQTLVWTAATLVWTFSFPGWWRAVWPVAVLLTMRLLYSGLREAVQTYCDLVEASVGLHRDRLYTGFGWPPPISTADERRLGRELSVYLAGWEFTEDQPLAWPDPAPPLPVAVQQAAP